MVEGLKIYFYFLCKCCACMCVCAWVCTVPSGSRREHWIPLNWSYRHCWATTWMLGSKLESSAKAVSVLVLLSHLSRPIRSHSFLSLWFDFFFLDSFACLQISWCHLKRYLFYILNIVSLPPLFPVFSPPHPLLIHFSSERGRPPTEITFCLGSSSFV